MPANIINIGYDSTNYYIIAGTSEAMLLVDCGWPGTMGRLKSRLKEKGVELNQVQYLLATHFHPDHAGLTQELRNAGLKLILMETQVPFVGLLKKIMKPNSGYVEIVVEGSFVLKCADSRAFLKELGIAGEILPTPGHSPDSVSLILDEGIAFTGDLTHESMLSEDDVIARESWHQIRRRGARIVYPAHGILGTPEF
jgi:glyoxylase-like metal-dependent hydrolase (beta-lactamase superfamily II)